MAPSNSCVAIVFLITVSIQISIILLKALRNTFSEFQSSVSKAFNPNRFLIDYN